MLVFEHMCSHSHSLSLFLCAVVRKHNLAFHTSEFHLDGLLPHRADPYLNTAISSLVYDVGPTLTRPRFPDPVETLAFCTDITLRGRLADSASSSAKALKPRGGIGLPDMLLMADGLVGLFAGLDAFFKASPLQE